VIEVVHSDFTFPYRNMQQSPAPNRPQFKIGFTIAPGAAVLPLIEKESGGNQVSPGLQPGCRIRIPPSWPGL
jgi:hypothetical protein